MLRTSLRRLLWLCVTSALLLLPLCYGVYDYDYDTTTTTDYGDYNATFEYHFFSNSSSEELEKFLNTAYEEEDEEQMEFTTMTTEVAWSEASRTASASLLLSVALTLNLLLLRL